MFQQIILTLCQLLSGLVLMESAAVYDDLCHVYGYEQRFIILPIEHWEQVLGTLEAVIQDGVFLCMAHRLTYELLLHMPAVLIELLHYHRAEIIITHSIVTAQCCGVIVEHHGLEDVRPVVMAEVIHQLTQLTLLLDKETLYHLERAAVTLAGHQPVDIGVIVKRY